MKNIQKQTKKYNDRESNMKMKVIDHRVNKCGKKSI